jgi:hypothetical protein
VPPLLRAQKILLPEPAGTQQILLPETAGTQRIGNSTQMFSVN